MERDWDGRYLAYMLRLWQTGGTRGPSWRATLEQVPAGPRRAFADVQALFAYLRQEMEAPSMQEPTGRDGR